MEYATENNVETESRKPSTAFLVVVNGLGFLLLFLPGGNPIGLLLAIPATALFVAVSGVWQAVWGFLDRRYHFHNLVRCIGFMLPLTLLVALPFLGIAPSRPINKQSPAFSTTGKHQASVLAESAGRTVEIRDADGQTLHDEQTEFVPHLNVYWKWGTNERLWIYNSDDGRVHCWYPKSDGAWAHVIWGDRHTQQINVELGAPPSDLYPDDAQSSRRNHRVRQRRETEGFRARAICCRRPVIEHFRRLGLLSSGHSSSHS